MNIIRISSNCNQPNFNGLFRRINRSDLRTSYERAVAQLNKETNAKIEYIKEVFKGSPLVQENYINKIWGNHNEALSRLEKDFLPNSYRFFKKSLHI